MSGGCTACSSLRVRNRYVSIASDAGSGLNVDAAMWNLGEKFGFSSLAN